MAEPNQFDALQFVDVPVERRSAWGPGEYASRQIQINGQLLSDYLAARTGAPVEQSTPLVDSHVGVITPGAYLRALLGGPKDDQLAQGRVAIGYCDACLDGTCGTLLAATLGVEGDMISWTDIGFDVLDEAPAPKLTPFWKKAGAEQPPADADALWKVTPFAPKIDLRFPRELYLDVLQTERKRLAPHE